MDQKINFARSSGNHRIAYALSGEGPPLVRVGTWLTHLQHDWNSPIWRHWFEFFSEQHTLVRYDPRGCGLSDRDKPDVTFEGFVNDLEAVIDQLGLETFPLFGMSQGVAVAIEYAARHPERVSQLVLYSGGPIGWDDGDPESEVVQKWSALEDLIKASWGDDNPAIRSMFVSYFVPGATPEEQRDYTESARKSASREVAGQILRVIGSLNVVDRMQELTMPTQVIQVSEDGMVPPWVTEMMAESIPDAEFVSVDSKNHILRDNEPGWSHFKQAFRGFLGTEEKTQVKVSSPTVTADIFGELTERESEILRRMAQGHKNAQIAETLFISEKTVRNHITNIFSKLDVNSRAEAIVLAKDNGL